MRNKLKTWRKEKMTAEKFDKIKGTLAMANGNPVYKNRRGGGIDYQKLTGLAKTSAGVLRKIDITDSFEYYINKQRTTHERSLAKLKETKETVVAESQQVDLFHVPTIEQTMADAEKVTTSDKKVIDALYAIRAAIKEHDARLIEVLETQGKTNSLLVAILTNRMRYMPTKVEAVTVEEDSVK